MRLAVVIPVKDRAALLAQCLEALCTAIRHDDPLGQLAVRVYVADNGSRDGTVEVAQRYVPVVHVVPSTARYVGGVRNDGARAALREMPELEALVFLDADCIVPPDFLSACGDVFAASGATAIGCEVRSRPDGHWTERVWDTLHRPGGDGTRHYINSACFAIRRPAFEALEGFDPHRPSSEDVDICQRLTAAGGRLFQSERLAVLHLGNPQTLAGYWRRIRWHNEGVFDASGRLQRAPMVYATLLHALVLPTSLVMALPLFPIAPWLSAAAIGFGLFAVPLLFVLARMRQHRRYIPLMSATLLMGVTFPARLHGMWTRWSRGNAIAS